MRKIILLASFAVVSLLISCVSSGKYDAVVFSRDSLQILHDSLENVISIDNKAMKQMNLEMDMMKSTLADLRTKLDNMQANYNGLKKSSTSTSQELMDNIEKLQKSIADKQKEMFDLQTKMEAIQKKLKSRDDAMDKLKAKLQEALVGFAEKGMTVSIKNGKVYVSLSNQLLFSSGSTDIDKKGQEALVELSKILNEQKDINILVEGHTDDQAVKPGAKFKDNWDLSVLRSTEVVRFLTVNGGVDPLRVTASGRSEYVPVEKGDTPEIRALNRRTEIILTPKLEELFDLLKE
jgi:chemotaxis protein MotB